jgi:hypothetical protein
LFVWNSVHAQYNRRFLSTSSSGCHHHCHLDHCCYTIAVSTLPETTLRHLLFYPSLNWKVSGVAAVNSAKSHNHGPFHATLGAFVPIMHSYAPTAREICLLGCLLVALLTFTGTFKETSVAVSEVAKLRAAQFSGHSEEELTSITYDEQFSLQALHAPLLWGKGEVPQTEIVTHVPGEQYPSLEHYRLYTLWFWTAMYISLVRVTHAICLSGWTMFDKLYFKHGTFYIVTDDPTDVPPLKLIISSGIFLTSGPTDELKRLPTDKDMRIIDTSEAKKLFGDRAQRLDGVTVRSIA